MKNVLFIDGVAKKPYTLATLNSAEKIGGTEVTILRTAEILAQHYNLYLTQLSRKTDETSNQIHYLSYETAKQLSANKKPDVIVIIRPRREVMTFANLYPDAKCFYWMHDIPSKRLWKYKRKFAKANCDIIAISKFQEQIIEKAWSGNSIQKIIDKLVPYKKPKLHLIYNPVNEALKPEDVTINKNKLLFFSAPDRGIEQILSYFHRIKQSLKNLELFIAHPGYASLDEYRDQLNKPGIKVIGTLPNAEIIQHIRDAFCIFYPQTKRPECFGLVYAESNAVGTPVLAHDFGAANEVLYNQEQLVDGHDFNAVLEKLENWQQQGRPQVKLKEIFRRDAVLKQWQAIL